MITRVHHVGIVVRDLDRAFALWHEALGLPLIRTAEVPDQGVRAALLGCGPCEVELLEPTAPDTGVGRFLARRGGGLHHVCLESSDVGREVDRLAAAGVALIDRTPREGLAGLIAFLHPRACGGVLVELVTPLDPAPLPSTTLALRTVRLVVEEPPVAARGYAELFRLRLDRDRTGGGAAQLAVGGVALRFDRAAAGSVPLGLAGLDLEAPGIGTVAGTLRDSLVSYREEAGRLVLDPASTHGVPLTIGERRAEEGLG